MNIDETTPELTTADITPNASAPRQPVFWQIVVVLVFLIGVFSAAIVSELRNYQSHQFSETPTTGPVTNNRLRAPASVAAATSRPAPEPFTLAQELTADAAIVLDISNNDVLYAVNEHATLPLASVSKLMTALVTYELLEQGETIIISQRAIRQLGNSGLSDGEAFTVANLNDLVLMTSSNDGAYALAEAAGAVIDPNQGLSAFIAAMNVKAESLGLTSLHFLNPTGLDLSTTQSGGYGSAEDVARLLGYIVTTYPELLTATTEADARIFNESGLYHEAANTNAIVTDIPGLIGSKTGYTDLAGGNLAIAIDAGFNRPIAIVVLGSTRVGRFEDVAALTTAAQRFVGQGQ